MMTSSQIRQSFLDFFEGKQHDIVPSSPVVLPTDPTLLFANAGMNQFKEIFLGARKSSWKRVANTQKCIRVSGKHNDLEEVGRDTYHHTFFEMLGNWSFGDYYKREAIVWAWELLTGVWKLPKERLWVTVYETDDEAADIWRTHTNVNPDHILRFGAEDNFWEMGETGPCGPCSEIHFDLTSEGATPDLVNAGTPEVIEIWNLVFMQYNRRADGSLADLPAKCVDTGMGFERIVAVLQGKTSNYDTDIFSPIIAAISKMAGVPYADGENAVAMRVIADHLRTLSFAIADGVMPSNEGRGYVLRRLLRRAARYGRNLGLDRPFLWELFPVLEAQMSGFFPELKARRNEIIRAIRAEEESFSTTLDRGIAHFNKVIEDLAAAGTTAFPGGEAFKLYDTYGFPFDLTVLMATEKGFVVDAPAFERHMQEQRDRARAARKDATADNDLIAHFVEQGVKSRFTGYDTLSGPARVVAMIADGQIVESLAEGQAADILLDTTPFYGEAGGQIGDTGLLTTDAGALFTVADTQKPADGIILHRGTLTKGALATHDNVTANVDEARRAAIRRHHTATHLLNAALRKVLKADTIKQAGSYVAPDRLRFDFTWFEALTLEQIQEIERLVTEHIMANARVKTYEVPLQEIQGSDIIAVFDEKYGDTVRVIETEGISRELCGGTHCDRSGDIGPFRIIAETSIAAGIRRIEAQVGGAAAAHTAREHAILTDLAHKLSVAPAELPARGEALQTHAHQLEKELKAAAQKSALEKGAALAAKFAPVGDIPVLIDTVGELETAPLRALVENLRQQTPDSVILLAATSNGKVTFILNAGPAAQAKGVHAGKLVGQIAKVTGGGGGGKPDKAQAGGKDPSKLPDALQTARDLIAEVLG